MSSLFFWNVNSGIVVHSPLHCTVASMLFEFSKVGSLGQKRTLYANSNLEFITFLNLNLLNQL